MQIYIRKKQRIEGDITKKGLNRTRKKSRKQRKRKYTKNKVRPKGLKPKIREKRANK